ncbi:universal stress protein [Halotalea alkalilenta]|uniref:universal stress protein n=1 Tax=Halotalea alkalilenta TaxID=376489 RepID=UPI0004868AFF|nr:universal stress protein [Halotalea alkalilenta]
MSSLKTLLFATDFSSGAAKASAAAVTLARLSGARLHVIHAAILIEKFLYGATDFAVSGADERRMNETIVKESEKALEEFVARYFRSAETGVVENLESRVIKASMPHEAIIEEAERIGADIIILGTHGRSGLERVLMGSTAERVMRSSPIPVLTSRG